jgi:hypothetical protein
MRPWCSLAARSRDGKADPTALRLPRGGRGCRLLTRRVDRPRRFPRGDGASLCNLGPSEPARRNGPSGAVDGKYPGAGAVARRPVPRHRRGGGRFPLEGPTLGRLRPLCAPPWLARATAARYARARRPPSPADRGAAGRKGRKEPGSPADGLIFPSRGSHLGGDHRSRGDRRGFDCTGTEVVIGGRDPIDPAPLACPSRGPGSIWRSFGWDVG